MIAYSTIHRQFITINITAVISLETHILNKLNKVNSTLVYQTQN